MEGSLEEFSRHTWGVGGVKDNPGKRPRAGNTRKYVTLHTVPVWFPKERLWAIWHAFQVGFYHIP